MNEDLKFPGSYEELKIVLGTVCTAQSGSWTPMQPNLCQFRRKDGGILNWYPTTGKIQIQGKENLKADFKKAVSAALVNAMFEDIFKPNASGQEIAKDITAPEEINNSPDDLDAFLGIASIEKPQHNNSSGVKQLPPTKASEICQTIDKSLKITLPTSDLVIALVGAVGTRFDDVVGILKERLEKHFKYDVGEIRISREVIPQIIDTQSVSRNDYDTIVMYMNSGNAARAKTNDNSILALGAASLIKERRKNTSNPRKAFIINSLKNPDEVHRLREIYSDGFFLISIHADEEDRKVYLTDNKNLTPEQAQDLIDRDYGEDAVSGQKTSDTFHLADFFVHLDNNIAKNSNSLWRIIDLIFGSPILTPTFDEYAMFMAFSASLRSADLSRQVGAVVARDFQILATGANDCPQRGGGLYWPTHDETSNDIKDFPNGRDYTRKADSNKKEQEKIINSIIEAAIKGNLAKNEDRKTWEGILRKSQIKDLIEYGRVVHAEMEALLCCARNNITSQGATLYCTTFPCHNCAKHIIAAGIRKVVYIEPYPKSKALEFHSEAITIDKEKAEREELIYFEPFVGIGPRKFFDLFSMNYSSGYKLQRKDKNGNVVEFVRENATMRTPLMPCSYTELENKASERFNGLKTKMTTDSSSKK